MVRSLLQNLKRAGQHLKAPQAGSFLTAHDVNHHLHIPHPGRVQHYRAEALPFVPTEIKTQIRFPKAYAMSSPSLRYLDQVRGEIDGFMKQRVQTNYFTGENDVPLSTSLGEVEVLYGASQGIKDLASTGELQALHTRVSELREESDRKYQNIRDRLLNVIKTSQDEQAEVDKEARAARDAEEEFNADLSEQSGRLRVEIAAGEQLVKLQNHWIDQIDGPTDSDSRETLQQFINHISACEKALVGLNKSTGEEVEEQAHPLSDQVAEIAEEIEGAGAIFAEYKSANEERTGVFSDFNAEGTTEYQATFRNDLLKHLATNIIVKENRHRYQKEQFDRLIISSQMYFLKNDKQSMDKFAENYTGLIEACIETSFGGKSPKIQANYDSFGTETIRPLNSAIFYYFFSASRARRGLAQWMLASARYPNQKVRRAYMKFFS